MTSTPEQEIGEQQDWHWLGLAGKGTGKAKDCFDRRQNFQARLDAEGARAMPFSSGSPSQFEISDFLKEMLPNV
jgi:hypothetical protein